MSERHRFCTASECLCFKKAGALKRPRNQSERAIYGQHGKKVTSGRLGERKKLLQKRVEDESTVWILHEPFVMQYRGHAKHTGLNYVDHPEDLAWNENFILFLGEQVFRFVITTKSPENEKN